MSIHVEVNQIFDNFALLLLQNISEGMQTGRIASVTDALSEIESARAQLERRREPQNCNEFVSQLLLDVGSLQAQVDKHEAQITELKKVSALNAATSAVVDTKERDPQEKVLRTSKFLTSRISKKAIPRPLRREGAFRGALDEIDWHKIANVYGRQDSEAGTTPSVPHRSDRSKPFTGPTPPFRTPRETTSNPPSLVSDTQFTTPKSGKDLLTSSDARSDAFTTPLSTPPSPTVGRGTKRVRDVAEDDAGIVSLTSEMRKPNSSLRSLQEPASPTPPKCEVSHQRKKRRSSASLDATDSGSGALSCTRGLLDVAHAI